MNFLYPSVFWIGLPIIALPLAIHLLNLRRRKTIPWAAMDFLLESQQQSRSWIQLQELLLLLFRTAAIALLVVMLARPTTRSSWLSSLVDRPVHYMVLLDDSYSTTDRWGETNAWNEAIAATKDILQAAADQNSSNVVSILRGSEAAKASDDPRPELFRQSLDSESRAELVSRLDTTQPTDTAPRLEELFRRALELCELQPAEQDLVVSVVSDFRQIDLASIESLQESVAGLSAQASRLQFVRTVRQQHSNLAITKLEPESGVRAADVELWMNVSVANYGPETANDVVVEFTQDGSPLVAVPLGAITAGATVDRRFRATFAGEGSHWLRASIDADAVEIDNSRVYAATLPATQQVLMVDGSPGQWESYYLATALAPGGQARSGWSPQVIAPNQLASVGALNDYAAIALLDVPRLDDEENQLLQGYLEAGGGLFVVLGESIDREFYREVAFADGEGWLPAPPAIPTQWLAGGGNDPNAGPQSEIEVSDHPMYHVLRGDRNSMLALMRVNYYYSLLPGWNSKATQPDSVPPKILATLAGREPLVLEKAVGRGKVIEQLTQVSPREGKLGSWSNWGPNPAFVVLANELFAYLANGATSDRTFQTGQPLSLSVDSKTYSNNGTLTLVDGELPYQTTLEGDPSSEKLTLISPYLERTGLFEIKLNQLSGQTDTLFAAVNPAAGEGDLALATDAAIGQKFASEKFSLHYADEMKQQADSGQSAWTDLLLSLLVGALVIEQALAYWCSFHD